MKTLLGFRVPSVGSLWRNMGFVLAVTFLCNIFQIVLLDGVQWWIGMRIHENKRMRFGPKKIWFVALEVLVLEACPYFPYVNCRFMSWQILLLHN